MSSNFIDISVSLDDVADKLSEDQLIDLLEAVVRTIHRSYARSEPETRRREVYVSRMSDDISDDAAHLLQLMIARLEGAKHESVLREVYDLGSLIKRRQLTEPCKVGARLMEIARVLGHKP